METFELKELGNKLRTIRESKGYKQEFVAFNAGVAQTTISKIELGEIDVSITMLKKVLNFYDCSLGSFFNWDGTIKIESAHNQDKGVFINNGSVYHADTENRLKNVEQKLSELDAFLHLKID